METVLVVDDDMALCHFLTKALCQKGYQAIPCHNGKDALQALRQQAIDLILLDNRLHDEEGLEIIEDIRKDFPKVPVILMTAFGTTGTAIEAM